MPTGTALENQPRFELQVSLVLNKNDILRLKFNQIMFFLQRSDEVWNQQKMERIIRERMNTGKAVRRVIRQPKHVYTFPAVCNKHKFIDLAKGYFKDNLFVRDSRLEGLTLGEYQELKKKEEEMKVDKVTVSKRNVFGNVSKRV